ncbi:glycosyltransferase [Halobacterium sp. CBA1126]|nr:glycosyltransferase [Halobacterium sp. CBA1126]
MPPSSDVLSSQRVCLLYQGDDPHPAHVTFGTAVDADFVHFETGDEREECRGNTHSEFDRLKTGLTLSRSYDVVIAEGSAPLQTLLAYGLINPDATLVFLAADETFYELDGRPTRYLWRALGPLASRLLDGVIPISDDVDASIRRYIHGVPSQKVYPPIADAKHEQLRVLTPSSPTAEGIHLLTVGTAKPANNYPMLCDASSALRDRWRDGLSLTILGPDHPDEPYSTRPWIKTPGYVDIETFVDFFDRATMYVQPSSGDAFSVAAAEGMLSGTPTVVTTGVGARELVDDSVVAELTAESLTETLKTTLERPAAERVGLGKTQRKKVIDVTEDTQAAEFRDAITSFHHD